MHTESFIINGKNRVLRLMIKLSLCIFCWLVFLYNIVHGHGTHARRKKVKCHKWQPLYRMVPTLQVDCTPPTYVICLLQKRIMPSPVKLHSAVTSSLISTEEASVRWKNGASGRTEFGHTGLHYMPDGGGVWTLCSFYVVCKYLLLT
jgi:hypothetical protein